MEDYRDDEYEPTLQDYLNILLRRKWIIIGVVVITTFAVAIGSLMMTPIYEASTTLRVGEKKSLTGGMGLLGEGGMSAALGGFGGGVDISTQVEILRSRSVLEPVVRDLGLVKRLSKEEGIVSKVFGYVLSKIKSIFQKPALLSAQEGEEIKVQETVKALREGLMKVGPISRTRLIRLSVQNEDPSLARDIANAVAASYIQKDIELSRGEATAVYQFASEQVGEVGEKLSAAEERLLEFEQIEGVRVLDEEAKLKVMRLAEIETSYQEVRISREILKTRLDEVRKQLKLVGGGETPSIDVSTNPNIRRLRGELTDLQTKLTELEGQTPQDRVKIASVRTQIESTQNRIQDEVRSVINSISALNPVYAAVGMKLVEYESEDNVLAAKEEAFGGLLKSYESEVGKLPLQGLKYARLQRDRLINEELFAFLTKVKNQAQIDAAGEIGSIDIIDPAIKPYNPVKPRKKFNVMAGFALSLIVGVGLAFLLEYLDNTIKNEDEAKRILGMSILGVIPSFGSKKGLSQLLPGKRGFADHTNGKVELITRHRPKAPISEAYRTLRTNLSFVDPDKKLKTIAVTSSVPGEGKTTVATNLAISMALTGDRVLLVDADLRRHRMHDVFGLSYEPGLTNALLSSNGYNDVAKKVEGVEGLDILTTGPLPPNPSELLGSTKMREFISELKDKYDRIIFDAPPVVAVTDASVLGSYVDGVLLVVGSGVVERKAARRAKELLQGARVNILGGIVNGVKAQDGGYGGYYSYYEDSDSPKS